MHCNGRLWPYQNHCNFDLAVYGSEQNGRVLVNSEYDKENKNFAIKKIDLLTK